MDSDLNGPGQPRAGRVLVVSACASYLAILALVWVFLIWGTDPEPVHPSINQPTDGATQ